MAWTQANGLCRLLNALVIRLLKPFISKLICRDHPHLSVVAEFLPYQRVTKLARLSSCGLGRSERALDSLAVSPAQLDLFGAMVGAYLDGTPRSNDKLYRELEASGHLSPADLVTKVPVGKAGVGYGLAKRRVRWWQQHLKTQGVVLVNKIRMLDLVARGAKKVERVPQEVIDDALGRLMAMLE